MKLSLKKTRGGSKLTEQATNIKDGLPYLNQTIFCLILNVIIILSFFVIRKNLPPEVPLFYGLPEGEEQLVPVTSLVIPAFIALIIILFNNLLSLLFEDIFFKKVLIMTSFIITFFTSITVFKIIFLVGSL